MSTLLLLWLNAKYKVACEMMFIFTVAIDFVIIVDVVAWLMK